MTVQRHIRCLGARILHYFLCYFSPEIEMQKKIKKQIQKHVWLKPQKIIPFIASSVWTWWISHSWAISYAKYFTLNEETTIDKRTNWTKNKKLFFRFICVFSSIIHENVAHIANADAYFFIFFVSNLVEIVLKIVDLPLLLFSFWFEHYSFIQSICALSIGF